VCKAHRLMYHSTLGLRVIKKKKSPQVSKGAGFAADGRHGNSAAEDMFSARQTRAVPRRARI